MRTLASCNTVSKGPSTIDVRVGVCVFVTVGVGVDVGTNVDVGYGVFVNGTVG